MRELCIILALLIFNVCIAVYSFLFLGFWTGALCVVVFVNTITMSKMSRTDEFMELVDFFEERDANKNDDNDE